MQGTLHLIPAKVGVPHRFVFLDRPVRLQEVQDMLGVPMELIPELDTVQQNGKLLECQAFMPVAGHLYGFEDNNWATVLWKLSLVRKYGKENSRLDMKPVGDVVVVAGDDEFMDAL